MKAKSKKIVLLTTTLVTLGTVSTLLFAGVARNGNSLIAANDEPISRTVRAYQDNRFTIAYYKDGAARPAIYNNSFFQLNGGDYAYVETSASQKSVETNNNDCAFALWTNTDTWFIVNPWQSTDFYRDDGCTQEIKIHKFDHLTRIDIILDNSESNRATSKFDCVRDVAPYDEDLGVIGDPIYDEENQSVTYTWTPNNAEGYITGDDSVLFRYQGSQEVGKVFWVRELVFYYVC